jgi:AraC family transcriptional activator FtrA
MSKKLEFIQNWPELARQANWSAVVLAKKCAVSSRSLHRYFLEQMRTSPKMWLAEQRLREAMKLSRDGSRVKEVASKLGYKHHSSFTRKYKNCVGACPSICKCCGLCLSTVALDQPHLKSRCPQMTSNSRK